MSIPIFCKDCGALIGEVSDEVFLRTFPLYTKTNCTGKHKASVEVKEELFFGNISKTIFFYPETCTFSEREIECKNINRFLILLFLIRFRMKEVYVKNLKRKVGFKDLLFYKLQI